MNILITGSAGFIGSNLVDTLKNYDHKLLLCDRKYTLNMTNLFGQYLLSPDKLRKVNFDVKKIEIIQPEPYEPIEKIDFVFHLGAISDTTYTNEKEIMTYNYDFSVELFNFCSKNNIPIIYASSAATYGDGKKGFSDNLLPGELTPLNLYAKTKNMFDEFVLSKRRKTRFVGLKFFNVYGYGEFLKKYSMTSLIHKGINEVKKTGKLKLFEFGEQKRDFVFIEDVIDVMMWFMNNKKHGIFNVGTGKSRSFSELADCLFSAMNIEKNIEWIKMPEILKGKYQDFTEGDISKLKKAGYKKEFTSLEIGAKKTYNFYSKTNIDFEKMEKNKFSLNEIHS